MFTDVSPMVTDVYPMVAEESSVANPQKVAKIDENIRKMQKRWVGNTVFADELPDSSVLSVVIDVIGSHRWHQLTIGYYRLLSVALVMYPIHFRQLPVAKSASVIRENQQPKKRPESSRIFIGFGRSLSVPGLQFYHFYQSQFTGKTVKIIYQ
jgi:hypothetical protein